MQASAVPMLQLEAGVLPPHHPHRSQASHAHACLVLHSKTKRIVFISVSSALLRCHTFKAAAQKINSRRQMFGFSGWTSGSELEHEPSDGPSYSPESETVATWFKIQIKKKTDCSDSQIFTPHIFSLEHSENSKCSIQENKVSGHH